VILLVLAAASGLAAVPLGTDTIRVLYQDTARVDRPGMTAAYAVEPAIVEASVSATQVSLLGAGVGTTRVTVVGPGGVETWNVVVESPPSTLLKTATDARRTTVWSEQYDSETSRVTTALNVDMLTTKGWPVALRVVNLTRAREENDGFARTSFPLASLSFGTPQKGIIVGDELVTRSPLTLDGALLRGVHLRAGRLEVHTGFASSLMLGSLFVPAQRETALGVSWAFGTPSFRVSPSLYAFPDAGDTRPGARTLLPGVLVEKEGKNGLFLLGELGWSDALAAAWEAAYDTPSNRVRMRLRHQPFALPALSIGHPQGSFGDLSWSVRAGRRLGLTLSGAAARYDDPRAPQRTAGGSADIAWSIARHWSARAGASVGRYDAEGAPRVETLGQTAGLAFDTGRFGLSALYRHQTNSATNRGGPGGHVAAHLGGRLRLSAYADYQRDAPTLSILLADYPEVARALAEQGLVARTPEDIARLLDAHALLLGGESPGAVRLTLDPSRLQMAVDLTWSGAHTRVRLHGLANRTETTSAMRETRLATLSVTQAFGSTELNASYTRWASDVAAFGDSGGAFNVGFRQRFAGGIPGASRRARIAGQVYREAGPAEQPTMIGVPGITIRLGDGRSAVTDAGGNFRFDDVGRGARRVQAILPAPNAFFTTPSTVEVKDSAVVRFGLRYAEGRLGGTVRDDAGRPFGGLLLHLAGATGPTSVISDGAGGFVFGVPEGDYTLRADGESLPPGYELVEPALRDVHVSLTAPAHADVAVRAQRSLAGRVLPARAGTEVRLRTANRTARTDDQGRYLFRAVGPGPETVEATIGGRVATRVVDVPEEPASLRDVDLGAGGAGSADGVRASPVAAAVAHAADAPTPSPASGARSAHLYYVQFSAHRDRAEAVSEAERLGATLGRPMRVVAADLGARGLYHRVLVGEFPTAAAAQRFRAEARARGTDVGPVHRIAAAPEEQTSDR
jgi:hypothetical protein